MTCDNQLCFSCMKELTAPGGICPHCGHNNQHRDNGPGMLGSIMLNNQYQVGKVLGRGGFGITYIGYDHNLQTRVAIKEYYPAHLVQRNKDDITVSALSGSDKDYQRGVERALRESRMAAGLRNIPGVVQVYNVFQANHTVYIVMDYVEGKTLSHYVQDHSGRVLLPEAIHLLAPVARALQALHSRNVIHRDVKPDNIMIHRETGEGICVIDLDTTMPGLSINDFGDSIRFGANHSKEDEKDLSKVNFDIELYKIYTRGFLEGAQGGLTDAELEYLPWGAKLMTLECGIRFLTDYLDGDHYFRIHYADQNLDRCRTQFKLVKDMEEQFDAMAAVIRKYAK